MKWLIAAVAKRNWKTTLGAVVYVAGAGVEKAYPEYATVGEVMQAVGVAWGFTTAGDASKQSKK